MADFTFIALPFPLVTKTPIRVLCLPTRVRLLRASNYVLFILNPWESSWYTVGI